MEFTVSSVLVPKSSAKVFGLQISLLALEGVDCVSLRSFKTFFGLVLSLGSGVESISLAGVTKRVWFSCVLSCSGVIGSAGMLALVGLLVEYSCSAKRSLKNSLSSSFHLKGTSCLGRLDVTSGLKVSLFSST